MKEWIYGKNAVTSALNSEQKIYEMIVNEQTKVKSLIELAQKKKIKISYLKRNEMDKLLKNQFHQGIAVLIEGYEYVALEELIKTRSDNKLPLLVMLDGIEDPHNLGAILRTGDCVGIDGVIIGKHRCVGLNSTVAKVSTGAIEYIKVCQVTNLVQTLKQLKQLGYWVVGTDGSSRALDYRSPNYDTPLVLVIGSEGNGISRLVKEECDYLVKIPMVGKVTSLNASVASAVLLYEIYNKQNPIK